MSGPTFTALALTSPLALYVESFALSAGMHGRDDLSWLWELPAVILGGLGMYLLDEAWMGRFSGWPCRRRWRDRDQMPHAAKHDQALAV